MVKHLGFDEWTGSIKRLLTTTYAFVILNGLHGKIKKFKVGVIQGDPLSPILYVIDAELLQVYLINHGKKVICLLLLRTMVV